MMRASILINNYNYERFVGVAVESSLKQSYHDVEVIVVDDGSSDESLRALWAYADSVTVVAKNNGGQASAYNEGFRRCTGDIVFFLDADDWLFPDAVQHVVAAWRPGVSKIQFFLDMVDGSGNSMGRRVPRDMSEAGAMNLLKSYGTYNSPPGSGNAYDSGFLRKIMPIEESSWRIAADTVPITLAPAFGRVISLPDTLGAYRVHQEKPGNLLMNNAPIDLWDEYRRIAASKTFASGCLRRLGVKSRVPMLWAPWEGRIATLCVRFGDREQRSMGRSRVNLLSLVFVSLWQWPGWPLHRKMLQSIWMLLVILAPYDLAHKIALRHKSSVGLPAKTAALREQA